jgi:hypothetical protein
VGHIYGYGPSRSHILDNLHKFSHDLAAFGNAGMDAGETI